VRNLKTTDSYRAVSGHYGGYLRRVSFAIPSPYSTIQLQWMNLLKPSREICSRCDDMKPHLEYWIGADILAIVERRFYKEGHISSTSRRRPFTLCGPHGYIIDFVLNLGSNCSIDYNGGSIGTRRSSRSAPFLPGQMLGRSKNKVCSPRCHY